MTDLEQRLADLGAHLAVPDTPDLVAGVARRLPTGDSGRRRGLIPRRRAVRRPFAFAAVALLLAAVGVAAVPSARAAVLDWLGLRGARIERVSVLPAVPPGAEFDLGEAVPLAQAEATLGLHVPVPAALGPPNGVYLSGRAPGGVVTLLYLPRPGLPEAPFTETGAVVSVIRGTTGQERVHKMAGPGTVIEPVAVGADRGFFFAGEPHAFAFVDANGQDRLQSLRLAANALILTRGPLLVRIEADLPKERMLAIAASLR